jgi:hypothetical protein
MQITITVSDDMAREAQSRGFSLQEFVESLVDKGLSALKESSKEPSVGEQERPVMNTAIERIRALRFTSNGR